MNANASSPARAGRAAPKRIGAPPGPRQAEQRRTALVEAAGKLFAEKGYEATTMDEIAAAAGFAKGTLYHYFENKSGLLGALREDFEKIVMDRIRGHVERRADDDWKGRIQAWVDAAVAAYFDMSELHDVVIYGTGMPFRNTMGNSEITKYLMQLISHGAKAGAWRVEDERWTAMVMFYSFRGGCDEAMMGAQPPEDIPKKLTSLFLRILGVD